MLIAGVSLGALLLPGGARALDHGEPFKIGVLNPSWGPTPAAVGLRDGLVQLGYRENQHFVIGVRFTRGDTESLYPAALELIKEGADFLFTTGDAAAMAAHRATTRIPVVFATASDPVQMGLVKSFARHGGNMTGITDRNIALSAKRIEVFKAIVPGLRRVLYLYSSDSLLAHVQAEAYRSAARRLGVVVNKQALHTISGARQALRALKARKVDGIIAPWDPQLNILGLILQAGGDQGVPTMFPNPFVVEQGGLASYGPSPRASGIHAARLMKKIMRGANPAEIPVEVNNDIEFTVNLKTAKALGIKVPPEVLYQATRILR